MFLSEKGGYVQLVKLGVCWISTCHTRTLINMNITYNPERYKVNCQQQLPLGGRTGSDFHIFFVLTCTLQYFHNGHSLLKLEEVTLLFK